MPAPTQELSNANITRILNLHQALCGQAKGLKRLSRRNRLLQAQLDVANDVLKAYETKYGPIDMAEFPDSLTMDTMNRLLERQLAAH